MPDLFSRGEAGVSYAPVDFGPTGLQEQKVKKVFRGISISLALDSRVHSCPPCHPPFAYSSL